MTAYEIGRAAFDRGVKCVPRLDPACPVGTDAMDDWTRGWTDANLAAPVPGWECGHAGSQCGAPGSSACLRRAAEEQ